MTNSDIQIFEQERQERISKNGDNRSLLSATRDFMHWSIDAQYSYNFAWMGRPIIQYPQDIVAVQELIWQVKPDLIIETGIAHGGSLIMSASMLALLDYCDALSGNVSLDPAKSHRKVIGIDIDIRPHNLDAIQRHPLATLIEMHQGSSIDPQMVDMIRKQAEPYKTIMVFLDSNHTHEHVLEELNCYAPLTSVNSYCVVFDTIVEDLADELIVNRPWSRGNSPKSAVHAFLKSHSNFEIDHNIDHKLLISVAPQGYLKRRT